MNSNLKILTSVLGVAALALAILSTAVSAQQVRGSVYGPYYNTHAQSNGTGTVTDANRDPHNDR
jgi:hypothetical protein